MSVAVFISPAMQMDTSNATRIAPVRAPHFAARSLELVRLMRALTYPELKRLWAASDAIAQPAFDGLPELESALTNLAQNKSGSYGLELPVAGAAALSAFKGIQYTYMAPGVMTSAELNWLDEHLFIGSGLFGVLRALDWVLPYRLEMKTKLPGTPRNSLYQFWGPALAETLTQLSPASTLVFASSQEYTKAVAPHASAAGLKTCELTFLSATKAGSLAQRAPECKIARGTFVRWCAEHAPQSVSDLTHFSDRGYAYDADKSQFPAALTYVKQTA